LGPALVVLCCDLGKGALAAYLGTLAHGTLGGALCGGAAWLGGAYSVFLGFQGGKGIGAGGGITLVTMPKVVAVLLPVWAVVVLLTRYVSLGSIIVAGLAPFAAYALDYPLEYVILAGVMGGLAILKHHSNIKRLIAGKERKLGEKVE